MKNSATGKCSEYMEKFALACNGPQGIYFVNLLLLRIYRVRVWQKEILLCTKKWLKDFWHCWAHVSGRQTPGLTRGSATFYLTNVGGEPRVNPGVLRSEMWALEYTTELGKPLQ
jgi:hypothetical protein